MNPSILEEPRQTLHGQRLCISCFYNLKHQPIRADTELGMWIVCCPECGQHASLSTYPALGRFEQTVTRILASAWIVAVIVIGSASALAVYGVSIAAGYSAPLYDWNTAMSGGRTSEVRVNSMAWVMVVVAGATGFVLGVLWRLVLLRSRGLVQRMTPILIFAAAFALVWQEASSWFEYANAWFEGLREVGAPMVVAAASAVLISFALGSFVALPVVRCCYRRLLLPRRLQILLPF